MPAVWWTAAMPELVQKRDLMHSVDKWQTMYVRYKCQPEAQVTQQGWDLSTSQHFADQLAAEEQQAYLREESLLYNGLAPTSIALRIVEAPAEFAVPVKQDRRLTPNFKVRVEVGFKNRCSFPLTLKVYVITQQEKDSVPEWVPDDFLDPDLPQRKPVTELKGTTVITHHFEGVAEMDEDQAAAHQAAQQQRQLAQQAAAALMKDSGADPNALANLNWSGAGDGSGLDQHLLEQVQVMAQGGSVDPNTAAALTAAISSGATLDALTNVLSGNAVAEPEVQGNVAYDYEFSCVELVKPTRMNKVYLVFACSILEQDLMFVVYNIPTVGICRAEQRQKACHKLGVSLQELGLDYGSEGTMQQAAVAAAAAAQAQQQQALLYGGQPGAMAAAARGGLPGMGPNGLQAMPGFGQSGQAQLGLAGGMGSRKRGTPSGGWGGADTVMMPDGLAGLGADGMGLAGLPPGSELALGMPGMGPMQVDSMMALGGLVNPDGGLAGMHGGLGIAQPGMLPPPGGPLGLMPAAAMLPGAPGAGLGGLTGAPGGARTRQALRQLMLAEYEATGLRRRLSPLDVQALELQAGFTPDASPDATLGPQQWEEAVSSFRARLKLLRLVANVWEQQDPCVIAGFDVDGLGAAQALASQLPGTFVCCLTPEQPSGLLVLCRVEPGGANGAAPGADDDGLLQAVVLTQDLAERRLEAWLRDLPAATHALDVYRATRLPKAVLLGSHKFTRLRAMPPLEAYEELLL